MSAERLVLALDIGATKTLLQVVPRGLRDIGAFEPAVARFATERDPKALVARIMAETGAAVAGLGRGPRIVAIGCAVPGPLDRTTGVVNHSPNLGWHDVPLRSMLEHALDAPAALEDDASAGALGEARFGAGLEADPFAYLTVSSGVGMGVIVGGRPLHGAHGTAGEVGHLTIDPTGPRCGCGQRGDVEAFAGGASIARRARAAWPSGWRVGGLPAVPEADGVFRAAWSGDPVARTIVAEAAEALGRALAATAAVLDPECFAVGGAIGLGQPALVRRATAIARRRCLAETGRSLVVVRAALGDRSVLAGAAALGSDLASAGGA